MYVWGPCWGQCGQVNRPWRMWQEVKLGVQSAQSSKDDDRQSFERLQQYLIDF